VLGLASSLAQFSGMKSTLPLNAKTTRVGRQIRKTVAHSAAREIRVFV
jgi:hypothetical protein